MNKKYQVFVSSTYTDLLAERQAAVEAILRCGHIPAGMELFSAGDESQLEVIKRWIDESDIYMLVLGGRYGSIEPQSSLSYTELEYNYAVSKSKPMFAVVLSDDAIERKVMANSLKFVERDEPRKLAIFREKVLTRLSGIVEDSKDIKLHVMNSILDLARRHTLNGWVRADSTTPVKPESKLSLLDPSAYPRFELLESFPRKDEPILKRDMKKMFLKFSNPIARSTACYIGTYYWRQHSFSQWDCSGGIQFAEGDTKLIWHMADALFEQEPDYTPLDEETYRFEIHIGRGPSECEVADIYGNKLSQIIIPVHLRHE